MNNNKLRTITLLACIFAVSFGLGFIGFKLLNKKSEPKSLVTITDGGAGDESTQGPKKDNSKQRKEGIEPKISASKPKLNGDCYSFVVTANNLPQNESVYYELYNIKGMKVKSSTNGSFSGIPGVPGGKYIVWLVGSKSGKLKSTFVQGCIPTDTDNDINKVTISISKPKLNDDCYSFVVTANNLPQNESVYYELYNIKGMKVKSSTNGSFSGIPGVPGGKYIVWLVGSKSGKLKSTFVQGCIPTNTENNIKNGKEDEIVERPRKMLVTKEDFQSKLLNANDMTLKMSRKASDKKSLLSKNFYVVVINMNSDENKKPTDIEGVREKIHFGIWKSASVTDISYDEATGQVTRVVIKPIY